jgi:hypothetical protein
MIKLCLDTVGYMSKPIGIQSAQMSGRIGSCSTEITICEFASAVTNGQSFATAVAFKNNKRKAVNWLGQQVFGVDIDKADYAKSTDELLEFANQLEIKPSIIYESFSSSEAQRKYRAIYITCDVITDPALALGFLRYLVKHFKADPACVDLARIFYGTQNKQTLCIDEQASIADISKCQVKADAQQHITHKAAITKETVNDLTPLEALRVNNLIQEQKTYLANNNQSRYERLKLLGVRLGSLSFISWELASQITTALITRDELLTQLYITSYDKDYLNIVEELYNWTIQQ